MFGFFDDEKISGVFVGEIDYGVFQGKYMEDQLNVKFKFEFHNVKKTEYIKVLDSLRIFDPEGQAIEAELNWTIPEITNANQNDSSPNLIHPELILKMVFNPQYVNLGANFVNNSDKVKWDMQRFIHIEGLQYGWGTQPANVYVIIIFIILNFINIV